MAKKRKINQKLLIFIIYLYFIYKFFYVVLYTSFFEETMKLSFQFFMFIERNFRFFQNFSKDIVP